MEHAHPLGDSFSWRGAAPALTLLLVVALAGLGGMALTHDLGGARPVPGAGRAGKSQAATPLRSRSRSAVLVLNGNGIGHAAGTAAAGLLADGYRRATAANAQSTAYARSVVLFRPGWQREANQLAKDAHVGTVAPLDGRLTGADAGYPLVVVLGR